MDINPGLAESGERVTSRLVTLVGVVVVIAGLYFGRQMLIPIALGVVFAFLLTPIVGLMEKCHLGRVPSVLAVLVLSFALLAAVGWAVTNQLLEVVVRLPDYKENIHEKIDSLRAPTGGSLGKATATVNDLSKDLSAASENAQKNKLPKDGHGPKEPIPVQVAAPPHNTTEYLRDLAGPLTGILETAGIVVILTLFILVKREDLRNRFLRLAGRDQLHIATQGLDDASQRLGRYLLLQFAVNAGYGVLFGLGLYFIGVPNPLLWGVMGSLLRFVPYIGTPVAAAFPMALAMAVFPGWSQVGLIFALFVILELTIANVLEPWLYGSHIGVSSLAILVAAIFWSMLWGPVGLILSTPLTLCLIILGSYIPQLAFLKILLGDEPVLSPSSHFYQRLLALDDDDARRLAKEYLKEHPLENLYDSLFVPALALAEQDRHSNALDEGRTRFILQSTRDLVEELYEVAQAPETTANGASAFAAVDASANPKMVCIPSRDEADEIVGIMVAQLLQRAGHHASALPIGRVVEMLDRLEESRADVVCISALPPFALVQARSLCKQIRQRFPKIKIVLGLWDFPGGMAKAHERGGFSCANGIGTSVAQIVFLMSEETILPSNPGKVSVEASSAMA